MSQHTANAIAIWTVWLCITIPLGLVIWHAWRQR